MTGQVNRKRLTSTITYLQPVSVRISFIHVAADENLADYLKDKIGYQISQLLG